MAVTPKQASLAFVVLACASVTLVACEQQSDQPTLGQTSNAISRPPEMGCSMQRYADHEYWFCPTLRTADDAQVRCAAQPWMHLARVDNTAEQTFINTYATTSAWKASATGPFLMRPSACGRPLRPRLRAWGSGRQVRRRSR